MADARQASTTSGTVGHMGDSERSGDWFLAGRQAELATVTDALGAASRGKGRVVVVEGEAGIGKSTLVDAALGRAGGGLRVFRAGAEEMESHRPFGVVAEAFDPGASRPEFAGQGLMAARADPQSISFLVAEGIVALLEGEAPEQPKAVVVEDLQWADPASLSVLYRLGRWLPQRAATLILTARPLPRRRELAALLEDLAERADHLVLGPLAEPEANELVAALIGARPAPDLMAAAELAGGNPLYLQELIGALADEGCIEVGSDGRAHATRPLPMAGMSAAILRRLAFLSAATTELLQVAAVLGVRFRPAELAQLLSTTATSLLPCFREALTGGVLHEEGDRLSFRHELVRDALYGAVPAAVRAGLHRDAAQALAEAGAPAIEVAEHILRGAVKGDGQAVSYLVAAAREAAARDPATAADLWARAAQLAGPDDGMRAEAETGLALSLLACGRTGEGEALCRRLLADGPPAAEAWALASALVRSLLLQGRLKETAAAIDQILASAELSPRDHGRLVSWSSQLQFWQGDLDEAGRSARAAAAAGEATGDAATQARAALTLACVANCRADLAAAVKLGARAVSLAERDRSRESYEAHAHRLAHALILADADKVEEAAAVATAGLVAAKAAGSVVGRLFAHLEQAYIGFFSGRWDDATAELNVANQLAVETGTGWQTAFVCLEAWIMLERRGPEAAERVLATADALLAGGASENRVGWVDRTRAACHAARGQQSQALGLLHQAWETCRRRGMAAEYRLVAPELAGVASSAGEHALAGEAADALDRVAARNRHVRSVQGAAARCRGLADGDLDHLLRAVAEYRLSPRRAEHAAAATDAAAALAAAGRSEEALTVSAEAVSLWQQLGADFRVSWARARWRQVGLNTGARGPRKRPSSGWDSLTPAEARVATLVARRLSNAEIASELFVSKRTIESHISRIFAKVGAHSRAELIARSESMPRG